MMERKDNRIRRRTFGNPPARIDLSVKTDQALVVLLDCSGSMLSKTDRAWEAFKSHLVPRLGETHLGVLLFPGNERDYQWAFTPRTSQQLGTYTRPLATGGTTMLPTLREGWRWLKQNAELGRIILITDGLPNEGGGPEEVLREAPGHGVPIDCVGVPSVGGDFGMRLGHLRWPAPSFGDYDPEFLRELSRMTGGQFTEVTDQQGMVNVLTALSPKERPALGRPK